MPTCTFELAAGLCNAPVWKSGDHCIHHEIYKLIYREYERGSVEKGFTELAEDEEIQTALTRYYGIRADADFLEWIRQVIALFMPAKNKTLL
jgi:hypothetical protein